ncbi:MAG: 16S rRNA (uracil(1498)-N(3))-methyltransferase [Oscillospiraceae bacterium]|nr:16S rRNA (uracil(1498)-N(3))-methyltransferase [Oscillospiraceae bacterium]
MNRFFVTPQDIIDNIIRLCTEDAKHIRSLRLRPEETFSVCDGTGIDYICKLGERDSCTVAEIVDEQLSIGEPTVKCSAYMAYSKGDRLDFAVQKSVELGVYEIILFESERCVAVPKDIPKKVSRLQRIALETAKLCNRGIVPKVTSGGNLNNIIDKVSVESSQASNLVLFFYECENRLSIRDILEQRLLPPFNNEGSETKAVSIITGPEGGFEPHEAELARSKKITTVSLGTRILRSETAPVIALAAVMYHTENL